MTLKVTINQLIKTIYAIPSLTMVYATTFARMFNMANTSRK